MLLPQHHSPDPGEEGKGQSPERNALLVPPAQRIPVPVPQQSHSGTSCTVSPCFLPPALVTLISGQSFQISPPEPPRLLSQTIPTPCSILPFKYSRLSLDQAKHGPFPCCYRTWITLLQPIATCPPLHIGTS